MSGTIILPTFSGHFSQAQNLINSIRNTSPDIKIHLILSKDDKELFKIYEKDEFCQLKYIEDLLMQYANIEITASTLLTKVGKFKYQAIKKILGVLFSETELALILDSETNIVKDLNLLFEGGIEETTVLYSARKWDRIPPSLTTVVHNEVNSLLSQNNDYWFFESFNWLYDVQLLKQMLDDIEKKFGKDWIFRDIALFECQLYYQYAYQSHSRYKFVSVEDLFLMHFGKEYGQKIIDRFWNSSFTFCGMIEYAGYLMSREQYLSFITDPEVLRHLRLVRHEPATIYDVVNQVRQQCSTEYYYGEAAMHRGDFTRGKIAVLISGNFHSQDDILNIKDFLAGIDCDIFVATQENSYLIPQIAELLKPVEISEIDDNIHLGRRSKGLAVTESFAEKEIKHARDIGSESMFDKLSLAYQNMKKNQLESGENYTVIVRVRPDIFSGRRLKDIFFQVAEHSQVANDRVFFPNRFWSQGINDQLFFGKAEAMSALLDNISIGSYSESEFLNPEYFLGRLVLNMKLKPVAFDFQYILTRGHYMDLAHISGRFFEQEHAFWSRTLPYPCWKDLSKNLQNNLDNIIIKNAQLTLPRVYTMRRKEVEFFFGKTRNDEIIVFTSEYKSPYVCATYVKKYHIPFLSYMMVLGYPYSVTNKNNTYFKDYDKKKNTLNVIIDKKLEVVTIFTPEVSFAVWGLIQCVRNVKRGLRWVYWKLRQR